MKCVIVDDHVMVLELLCSMLRTVLDWDVVASGTRLADAARLASLPTIDVLITDEFLGGTSSISLIRSLLLSHPQLKCILLTDSRVLTPLPDDMRRNVVAIVPKTSSLGELFCAMNAALDLHGADRPKIPTARSLQSFLTKREFELLKALGRGFSNKEVATSLGLSVRTVETHRKSLSKKLGCNGSALIRMAVVASITSLEMHGASRLGEVSDLAG